VGNLIMCNCQNSIDIIRLRCKAAKLSTNLDYALYQNKLGNYAFIELKLAYELELKILEII